MLGVHEVDALGHGVSSEEVAPSAVYVESIKTLEEPRTGEQLMRFLGLANYFLQSMDHFAEHARSLYNVLENTGFSRKRRHGQRFITLDWKQRWGQKQTEWWNVLEQTLSGPKILCSPRRKTSKQVMTDANTYGLGGVLLQKDEERLWRPVSIVSRQTKQAKQAYPVHEKECLAVVYALKK